MYQGISRYVVRTTFFFVMELHEAHLVGLEEEGVDRPTRIALMANEGKGKKKESPVVF